MSDQEIRDEATRRYLHDARFAEQVRTAVAAHIHKHVPPHALRRTFCTSGLLSGIPLRDMQLAMRHSQSTTTEIYDMAAKSFDRNASHRVASLLAGAAG